MQKFTSAGDFVTRWGGRGTLPGFFVDPLYVDVGPNGSVYVVDHQNRRVQKFTSDGAFLVEWGSRGDGPGQFDSPHAIAVSTDHHIFVLDFENDAVVQHFSSEPSEVQHYRWSDLKLKYRGLTLSSGLGTQ